MKKVISYLDNVVANKLISAQKTSTRRLALENTLSGSILGKPLQEQVLHILGVPSKDFDEYALRKFERGHHVEAWLTQHIDGGMTKEEILKFAKTHPAITGVDEENQPVILYKGATGHIDKLVDMSKWEDPELQSLGVIPHEVKSVANSKYKWIEKRVDADWSHKLQAGMYALAVGADHFVVHIVASDDYRILSFLYETQDIAQEIHDIMREVQEQLAIGKVPIFVPRENWQTNKTYQGYPTWSDLAEDEIEARLKEEYPECYKRLMSFKSN